MRRAFRLAELRKAGLVRESAIIAQAFFEWGHPDPERVRAALLGELGKYRSQLLRRRTTRMHGIEYGSLGAVQQRAIGNQLGALDPRFIGTQFEQSSELYATIAESAELNEIKSDHVRKLVMLAFERILPGNLIDIPISCLALFSNSLPGLLGSPEEISDSAESKIQESSTRNLRIARIIRTRMIGVLRRNDDNLHLRETNLEELISMNKRLLPQISTGPWAVLHFAQCLAVVDNDLI